MSLKSPVMLPPSPGDVAMRPAVPMPHEVGENIPDINLAGEEDFIRGSDPTVP